MCVYLYRTTMETRFNMNYIGYINSLYRVWLMIGIAPAIAPAAHQILHIISQVGSSHLAVVASDKKRQKNRPGGSRASRAYHNHGRMVVVSGVIGVPSHHPLLAGIFHEINQTSYGSTSICGNPHIDNDK